ncbi:glycosyltransferase [Georgenia sp. 10Sc9-8]|uniref:Glycosyltransferase n=1 Tax=Georgenia halotolerans TaxID=3028317 RepID=A0ABT5U058_9MICO|nr:glycosyltransferase [Georgenia halotolerans]
MSEHLVIAVLTYRRPDDLRELLPMLRRQARSREPAATVLVVDNDPAGGAESQAREMGVAYVQEPRPGIAAARNRALTEAADAQLLVFIDDDERPSPKWLQHLLATYHVSSPAAVVGPVVSRFAAEPSTWISEGKVFARRRLATGTEIEVAATNNLLLDMAQVRALHLRFDERFGLSGGSDTLFSVQLVNRGGRMVWCDEAVVTDVVPPHRATQHWVLQRAFRSGNGWSRVQLETACGRRDRLTRRAGLCARGTIRVGGGSAKMLVGALGRSVGLRARGARTLMRGAGMVTGAAGYVYSEYRR